MTSRPLTRLASVLRRSLGFDEISARLDDLDRRVGGLEGPRYPSGPLYLGDHQALVATRWGAKLVVDTRDHLLAPWLLLDGLWESHVTGWMHETLRPGDTFVDVGANVGYFTLLGALAVGERGRVVAVEAHSGLAELLRRNVVMNGVHGWVTVCERAAWSSPTTLKFHQRLRYAANSSVGALGEEALAELDDAEATVEVTAAPLDEMLEGVDRVDVVKVDVEGAEFQAFRGMERTLRAHPQLVVMFEWSPAQIRMVGDDPAALVDLLRSHGLRFFLLERNLAPVSPDALLDIPYGNVVARR